MKKILPDLIAIALFAVLSFAYFFPADLDGRILFQHDSSAGVGAGQEATEYYEATGERTRWTNSLFGGMPTYQIAPSYDTTQPLNWVEKAYRLFLPEYVQLTFILMLGFYILMRAFGMSAWLSALGGIIWAFSSYFFILISAGHIWKFITLAYIPPTIAGMVLVYRGKWLWGCVLTALFVALQIKSNHVQMSYYFLFVMLFMAIAYGVEAYKAKQLPRFWKATGVLVIAGFIGVATNLSNLYHTYSYSKETMRGKSELVYEGDAAKQTSSGLNRDYITQWSYGIGETWTLLVPNFKGGASVPLAANETAMKKANPLYSNIYTQLTQYFGEQPMTSGPVYVGAFVLFLFILGCFIVKGPMKWALLGATLFSILLSWGKNFMPLTDFFIDFVPMYNKFRAVSSILVIAEFTIPLLAILALKRIFDEPSVLKQTRNGLIVSTILTFGVALILWIWPSFMGSGFIPTQEMQMLQNALSPNDLAPLVSNMSEMRAAMVSADALRSMLIIAIGLAILYFFIAGKLKKTYTIGAIALLCLVDMWGVNKRYLNDEQFVPNSIKRTTFVQTPADKHILQDDALDYRVLNLTGSTFNENNTSYWHKSIGGYHAAKLRRYQEMIDHHISPEIEAAYNEIAQASGVMEEVDGSKFNVLNMLNTKYFVLPAGRNGEAIPIQNPYAYGNAWFVKNVSYVANANEEIETLYDINPRETAVVDKRFEETLKGVTTNNTDSLASITLTSYSPNHLVYETTNENDGIAIFSEIYYPDGWQVTIDGQPATLARANYILRALHLPAGKHVVEMKFDPQSLHLTEGIAYGALVLLLIGVITAICLTYTKKNRSYLHKQERLSQ
ncbi:MAG: YfhO family protein [Bacteroides sp.]|nr:YfhO family protein [Bacteroides sp.]